MTTLLNPLVAHILQRELRYADFALKSLDEEMNIYEKKYSMSWKAFLTKFEDGSLGDNRELFTWYGLALSAQNWDDTKKTIAQTLGTS